MLTQRKASRAFALSSLDSKFMAIFEQTTDDADYEDVPFHESHKVHSVKYSP